jgi:hypothetical protein
MEEFMKLSTITKTAMVLLVCSTMQLANAGGLDLFKAASEDLRAMSEVRGMTNLNMDTRFLLDFYPGIKLGKPKFTIFFERKISSYSPGYGATKRDVELTFVNLTPRDGQYFLIMGAGLGGEYMPSAAAEIEKVALVVQKALLKSKAINADQQFGKAVLEDFTGRNQYQVTVSVNSSEHLQRIIRDVDQAIKEANIEASAADANFIDE